MLWLVFLNHLHHLLFFIMIIIKTPKAFASTPGTCILGNIKIGDGAKIGACSVVLKEVPPKTTIVGNPARVVGGKDNPIKLDKMPSFTMDHTSWFDYAI